MTGTGFSENDVRALATAASDWATEKPPPQFTDHEVAKLAGLSATALALLQLPSARSRLTVAVPAAVVATLATVLVMAPTTRFPAIISAVVTLLALVVVARTGDNYSTPPAWVWLMVLGVIACWGWTILELAGAGGAAWGWALGLGVVAAGLADLGRRGVRRVRIRRRRLEPTQRLLTEAKQYNGLLRTLKAHDALVEAQDGTKNSEQRRSVIQALVLTRERLHRGLKVARVLRENADVLPADDRQVKDMSQLILSTETQRTKEDGDRYVGLLNETFELAAVIDEEYERLHAEP